MQGKNKTVSGKGSVRSDVPVRQRPFIKFLSPSYSLTTCGQFASSGLPHFV